MLPWLPSVLLAPVLEELLYRERLLAALRSRCGCGCVVAVVASSVLFALLGWRFCISPGTPENLKPVFGFVFFGFASLGFYKGINIILGRQEPPSSD